MEEFFLSFDENNKFVDAFFNPLNQLDNSWNIMRISGSSSERIDENVVLKSIGSNNDFVFKIRNDTNEDWNLVWIDFIGNPVLYQNLSINETITQQSYTNHVWLLENSRVEKLYFTLSKGIFKNSGCLTNISDIFEIPENLISVSGSNQFSFTLKNDLNESFKLYWINFVKNPIFYYELEVDEQYSIDSFEKNAWLLKSSSGEIITFICGDEPLFYTDCTINISEIREKNRKQNNKKTQIDASVKKNDETSNYIFDRQNGLQPYSAHQGRIGNCYMLQCLISIYARYPNEIITKFIHQDKMKKTGAVAVTFWCRNGKCWRVVVIDDFLPVNGNQFYCSSPSGSLNNEYWVVSLKN